MNIPLFFQNLPSDLIENSFNFSESFYTKAISDLKKILLFSQILLTPTDIMKILVFSKTSAK